MQGLGNHGRLSARHCSYPNPRQPIIRITPDYWPVDRREGSITDAGLTIAPTVANGMRLLTVLTPAILTLAALVGGCKCPSTRCAPRAKVAPCAYERSVAVWETPDLTELAVAESDSLFLFPSQLPGPEDSYRLIDAPTCQCNAATNAQVPYLLELEQHWASVLIDCESESVRKALCLTRDLLVLREAELRNKAAGAALTAFYLLGGVEVQLLYAQRGIDETQVTLDRIDSLSDKGLQIPETVDRANLAARLCDLQDAKLQLDLTRVQLNGQLKKLLDCPLDLHDNLLPQVDWRCEFSTPDYNVLAAEGIAHRSDVRSVRLAACRLEKATVPVARAVLAVADTALGKVEPQGRLGVCRLIKCGCCYEQEESIRRRQLCALLAEARSVAEAKIKAAAYQVVSQQQRVALARRAVLERRAELARLEKLRDVNDTSIFEISMARGRVYAAESKLVERVVELKVAQVALLEEQGLLVVQCGLGAYLCCEPPPSYTVPHHAACEPAAACEVECECESEEAPLESFMD